MKERRNRYLRQIKYLFWDYAEAAAIERLLEEYRYPGAPLRLIAANLGVADIIKEQLPFEGGIFDQDGKTIIKLNAFSSIVRQRFTLAHELAHLIFMQRFSTIADCMEDPDLETACDRLAADLLMPREETTEYLLGLGPPSPENLRVERFGVSLHVAARRLGDLGIWDRSIGLWELSSRPQQKWSVGKKLWHHPPSFIAFDLAKSAVKSVSTIENIPAGDHEIAIRLQMLNLGRNFFLGLIMTVS